MKPRGRMPVAWSWQALNLDIKFACPGLVPLKPHREKEWIDISMCSLGGMSMERYTYWCDDGNGGGEWRVNTICGKEQRGPHVDRLAAIEDILGDDYDLDRLRELVEADREKRCVIFEKGYGIVSEYEVDEEGFITRTATGVVTREEYDRVLKGEAYGG